MLQLKLKNCFVFILKQILTIEPSDAREYYIITPRESHKHKTFLDVNFRLLLAYHKRRYLSYTKDSIKFPEGMDEKKVLKESNQNLISFLHELSEKDLI
jgi:hypothetical protein